MLRVKIIKPHKTYKPGETIYVSRNEAFGLLDSGYAVMSKDMITTDYPKKPKRPRK